MRSGAATTALRPTLVRNAASRSVYEGSRRKSCISRTPILSVRRHAATPPAGGFDETQAEARAASTSSAWLSGFTLGQTFATVPSGAMRKVARLTPQYVLPM